MDNCTAEPVLVEAGCNDESKLLLLAGNTEAGIYLTLSKCVAC